MGTKFGLGTEHVRVEKGSLGPTHPYICSLPPPISVNAMFGQAPGKKRFHTAEYKVWIEEASLRLTAARPPKFPGQVWIAITYSSYCRFDLDNGAKCVLDLLVSHKVIKDDSPTYLRELRLSWGQNSGARVEIRPFPFADQARAA